MRFNARTQYLVFSLLNSFTPTIHSWIINSFTDANSMPKLRHFVYSLLNSSTPTSHSCAFLLPTELFNSCNMFSTKDPMIIYRSLENLYHDEQLQKNYKSVSGLSILRSNNPWVKIRGDRLEFDGRRMKSLLLRAEIRGSVHHGEDGRAGRWHLSRVQPPYSRHVRPTPRGPTSHSAGKPVRAVDDARTPATTKQHNVFMYVNVSKEPIEMSPRGR